MHMDLKDLPPRYRAQAEQQLAGRTGKKPDTLAEAVKQAKAVGREFDSRGEYEFYTGTVLPKMARGEIVEVKSKFVRRMQRDYPVRRRVFLEQIARPAGWRFTEIITADTKEDAKRRRELTESVNE